MIDPTKKVQELLVKCNEILLENESYLKIFEKKEPTQHARFKKSFSDVI